MGLFKKVKNAVEEASGKSAESLSSNVGDRLPAYLTGVQAPAESGGPVSLSKAAKVSVTKRPSMNGRKFALYLLGDMSGSMAGFIQDGSLDYLTEAILTLVAENGWDADNIVPAFPYATSTGDELNIKLGDHAGAAKRMERFGRKQNIGFGTTYYLAIEAMTDHYQASSDWGKRPAICVLQSDGIDNNPTETARVLTRASSLPIHFVMVYFGQIDPNGHDAAASMRALDKGTSMPGRVTDNVSLLLAGPEPKRVTPTELYDGLLSGVAQWLVQAPRDGVNLPTE